MDCLTPIYMQDKGHLPCGKCLACAQRRQKDWSIRLTYEMNQSTSCYFVTLTYDDLHVPTANLNGALVNVLCKRDFQLWMKRFRKTSDTKIRFFACGEYGTRTLRPHYHVILFNYSLRSDLYRALSDTWQNGFFTSSKVQPAHIEYVAKYSTMLSDLPKSLRSKEYRPFSLQSRRPAIGANYLTPEIVKYHRETLSTTVTRNGVKSSLPRYYREKIFDDQMKADIKLKTDAHRQKEFEEYVEKYGHADDPYRDSNGNIIYPDSMLQQKRDDFLRSFKQSKINKSKNGKYL